MVLNEKKILAIVPAYNEGETLPKLIAKLQETVSFSDLVVIDDCSTDGTRAWCREHRVPLISTVYNLGIGGAMQTGYRYALQNGYDIAVQVDGDGQHPPEVLQKLLDPLFTNEADLTIGSRFLDQNAYRATLPRFVGIKLFSFITTCITQQKITDVTSGYRAANRRAIAFFVANYPDDFPDAETLILASFAGLRIKEIPILMRPRMTGVSSFNFTKSMLYILKTSISIFAVLLSHAARKRRTL